MNLAAGSGRWRHGRVLADTTQRPAKPGGKEELLVGEEERKHHGGTGARETEEEVGQRNRGTAGRAPPTLPDGTCWRLLLQTQCCQPPSAPLESRQDVQLGRR